MLRRNMQRLGVVCLAGLVGLGARTMARPSPSPASLGRTQCVREWPREHSARRYMCHVGGTYILRFADSAGVGEGLHPSGPRLLAMASVPCRKRVASRSSAATLDCKVGNQEFVLDSAGVGEGMLVVAGSDSAGVGEGLMVVDSAGVGEGLVLNASMCKWVVLPAYGPSPVLQCMYGTIPIVVDTSRIAQ